MWQRSQPYHAHNLYGHNIDSFQIIKTHQPKKNSLIVNVLIDTVIRDKYTSQ